ncbi:hypothetical protein, unlikely [Trypanosoma brucei gambiense DAL972]|uniref:Uncharacterized protein n=1 Tax=Trypanosoma brucei gambiense (strain MHOM/CI/86/DAL972) TaxID=679716 RepID=C9ZNH6_TRYB9|nr:hypothetical protein, unlikely [Trypanosoma brucei gambiense DAL972]CBH10954.1 hypothetical protein, unlikely [Trypanosoma brucei gambiense DAL972]|eukprot:XP_011773241.1 hypothetical protein, unlikely [Trypanosoma brucei gambiense DAL972]
MNAQLIAPSSFVLHILCPSVGPFRTFFPGSPKGGGLMFNVFGFFLSILFVFFLRSIFLVDFSFVFALPFPNSMLMFFRVVELLFYASATHSKQTWLWYIGRSYL